MAAVYVVTKDLNGTDAHAEIKHKSSMCSPTTPY